MTFQLFYDTSVASTYEIKQANQIVLKEGLESVNVALEVLRDNIAVIR